MSGRKMNLYARYLLADRMSKVATAAGVNVDIVTFNTYSVDVHMQCGIPWTADDSRTDHERNEAAAVQILDAVPATLPVELERSGGLIYIKGTAPNGLTFRFYTGTGVCEMVQTGTRTERRPDPVALAAVPMVEVEVPVFERRCPEPDFEAVSA